MPDYRRAYQPGGSFFFTVVTEQRRPLFGDAANRRRLRDAFAECLIQRPFDAVASVLLPDHLHAIWTLPDTDPDFSTRWAAIKSHFTRAYLAAGGAETPVSADRLRHGSRGVWQERFWEHLLHDERDFAEHLDYIHYNPVKHGHVTCPHLWPWSTFGKWVKLGVYDLTWRCTCDGRLATPPDFKRLDQTAME